MYTPIVDINLAALKHNLTRVREYSSNTPVLAMVKANAYGHGLLRVARTLTDADAFGVARIEEGILLRQSGIEQPIVLMSGILKAEELEWVIQYRLDIVVHHEFQIKLLETCKFPGKISVWFKIDTGMNRLGFSIEDASAAYQRLQHCKIIDNEIKVLTHLSAPEDFNNPVTMQQFEKFINVTKDWNAPRSIAKSAAIMAYPEMHLDWVRPGIMLYGISPFANTTGADYQLQPVMTVRSCIVNVRQCKQGDRVGYGGHWICPEDMPIGVVSMGYGDGYPRYAPNGTPILINDKICGIAGRVSMDMLMVDLRACPDAKIGDPVVLWGEGLPIEHVAAAANTIPYTLLVALTQRLRFR